MGRVYYRIPEGETAQSLRARKEQAFEDFHTERLRTITGKRQRPTVTWWLIDDPQRRSMGEPNPVIVAQRFHAMDRELGVSVLNEGQYLPEADCPERFIRQAPVIDASWRHKVEAHHANRTAHERREEKLRRALTRGAKVVLREFIYAGAEKELTVISYDNGEVIGTNNRDGERYRALLSQIKTVIPVSGNRVVVD